MSFPMEVKAYLPSTFQHAGKLKKKKVAGN